MVSTWFPWADSLAGAYERHASSTLGAVRFELVTRAILQHLPARPARIVDVGGGYGRQAVLLARAGNEVVVVDPDERMLATASGLASREPPPVRNRVTTVAAPGEDAVRHVGAGFDVACCHSVLLYVDDPGPLLDELTRLVRPGGLLSLLCLNGDAVAMRAGLQRRWRDALTSIHAGAQCGDISLPTRADTVRGLTADLAARGVEAIGWHGVRVLTDHLGYDEPVDPRDFDTVCELEWVAGQRDPYRGVARLFHLLARRTTTDQ